MSRVVVITAMKRSKVFRPDAKKNVQSGLAMAIRSAISRSSSIVMDLSILSAPHSHSARANTGETRYSLMRTRRESDMP
jgi:hypothetical protein